MKFLRAGAQWENAHLLYEKEHTSLSGVAFLPRAAAGLHRQKGCFLDLN